MELLYHYLKLTLWGPGFAPVKGTSLKKSYCKQVNVTTILIFATERERERKPRMLNLQDVQTGMSMSMQA